MTEGVKTLLIIAHAPSENTKRLLDAVVEGARADADSSVRVISLGAFDATPTDVIAADAIILGTPENLGYMSGALKDFFDRCYYPCLERTQGRPYAAFVRAGNDGEGTRRGIERIVTGLRWRAVQDPLILRGEWREEFVDECRDLGTAMAIGLDAGIF